ncbi:MAG TPA: GGDEF domain-containing protein [Rhodanobacter sp.]|nr:GGDEF domain-containing protein [Rhodanobacter sp.]
MYVPFANRRPQTAELRAQHASYLAQRMAPMVRALLLMAVVLYLFATITRSLLGITPTGLGWRLLLAVPLAAVALAARHTQQPGPLSLLALACLLVLEVGISLNTLDLKPGQPWVIPGLLLPVASSVIWSGRWDFIAAMTLCALGPIPMLLLGNVDAMHINQYVVTMAVAIAVSAVLRAFMARTLIEQFHLEQRLREQASTDGLTGLLQRNRFLEMARTSLLATYSKQQTASMLYVDADHFKQINDDYGHAAGDAVLVALAAALRAHSRPTDLIGRMGGEEFALLLPGVSLQHASERAEQLRLAVRDIRRPDGRLTISIGVAECRHDCRADVDALLARADQAMRQAKRSGRDRAVNAAPATQRIGNPA